MAQQLVWAEAGDFLLLGKAQKLTGKTSALFYPVSRK